MDDKKHYILGVDALITTGNGSHVVAVGDTFLNIVTSVGPSHEPNLYLTEISRELHPALQTLPLVLN